MAKDKEIKFYLIDDFNNWLYDIGKKRGQYDSYINTCDKENELDSVSELGKAKDIVAKLLKDIDSEIEKQKGKSKKTLQSKRSGLRAYKRFLSYLPSKYVQYKYNGITELSRILEKNKSSLILHMISSSLFPSKDLAKQRATELANRIKNDEKIEARFSSGKSYTDVSNNETKFSSRGNAVTLTKSADYYFRENHIKVEIDSNGNYTICDYLKNNTPINIFSGNQNRNCYAFMICHIWGNAINPLFFSNFWNIVLIPQYLSFITDKGNEMASVKYAKDLYKALAYELYKDSIEIINEALAQHGKNKLDIKVPEDDISKHAKEIISKNLIKFIP